MNDIWRNPAATLDQVWQRLEQGVSDRTAPARHPVLATVGDGGEARIVVLRAARRDTATVDLHTDLRSAKVAHVRAEPRATLLVWDPASHLQIRLRMRIRILTGDGVAPDWDRVPQGARLVYGADPAPGRPVSSPDAVILSADPAAFAVLRGTITQIETLHLGPDLHRRCMFSATDGWQGQWLAP
jgi:pyridoxamine 5'-phosphate oxidase